MLRIVKFILRKFYLLLAVLVIVLAVVVQTGRSLTHLVPGYSEEIAQVLSQQTQTKVELGAVSANWESLQPFLQAHGLVIESVDGGDLASIEQAQLRLDLLRSLMQLRLVWSDINLSGTTVSVAPTDDGRWRLQGATPAVGDNRTAGENVDQLFNTLLSARRIQFENTLIHLAMPDGEPFDVRSSSLLVENRGDFHRLLVNLDVASHANAIYLLVESRGDPRRRSAEISSYLQLRDFPLEAAATLAAASSKRAVATAGLEGHLDASLWLSRRDQSADFVLDGEWSLTNATLPLGRGQLAIERASAEVTGRVREPDRWRLVADSLFVSARGLTQSGLSLSLAKDGAQGPLTARLSALRFSWLVKQLMQSSLLTAGGKLEDVLQQLNPRGQANNLALTLPAGSPDQWHLAAELDGASVDSWQGAPGVVNASGYLEASALRGRVQLAVDDGLSLNFDQVYDHPLTFDSARGQVAWLVRPEDNQVDVYSGPLAVSRGEERARGYFHLDLPFERNTGPINLTISLSAENVAAEQYQTYLPKTVPDTLTQILRRGIGSDNPGRATHADFVFRGVLNDLQPSNRSIGLDMTVSGGSFRYHENWPELHDIEGRLVVDDADVHGRVQSARVYNSRIVDAKMQILPNPDDSGRLLTVDGQLDGIASDGLRILRQSVLRRYVGDQMDSWYLHGELTGALDIAVPLSEGAQGGHQHVVLDVDASSFALDNFDLELEDFSGRITYENDVGIRTENIEATLFGEPLTMSIRSEKNSGVESLTVIEATTQTTARQLAQWSRQPAVLFAEGVLPLDIRVELNHRPPGAKAEGDARLAAVSVNADLHHSRVDLPAPLGKKTDTPGTLVVNYILGAESGFADVHYGDRLRAMVHLDSSDNRLLSGSIAFAAEPQMPSTPELRLTGELATLEPKKWLASVAQYRAYRASMGMEEGGGKLAEHLPVPVSADLMVKRQPLGPLALTDLRVRARQLNGGWDFLVNNRSVSGEIFWPMDKNAPLRIALTQLDIPKELLRGEGSDGSEQGRQLLERGAAADWPRAAVSIDNLSLAGSDYGQWQFDFEPGARALTLKNLTGEVRGLSLSGLEQTGGVLRWLSGEAPRSEFSGVFRTDDMADTLSQWGAPQSIESERAEYRVDVQWPGNPAQFALEALSGTVAAELGAGRFLRDNAGAGEGLLRLLGLFNFDSLARRLRLDFSDLYKSGLTFDGISGAVAFDQGTMNIVRPVQMRSPSGRMEMTGSVDLLEQTLNTRLVATIPMAGNLTVITALAAGLPAAAGVFVISKLFEDQMNKVTSVTYSISGSWENPVSEFEGVTDIEPKDDGSQ